MPHERSQKDFEGSLPLFKVEPYLKHKGFITVTCLRGVCKQTHVVKKKPWREASKTIARTCPYCFRVSRI